MHNCLYVSMWSIAPFQSRIFCSYMNSISFPLDQNVHMRMYIHTCMHDVFLTLNPFFFPAKDPLGYDRGLPPEFRDPTSELWEIRGRGRGRVNPRSRGRQAEAGGEFFCLFFFHANE